MTRRKTPKVEDWLTPESLLKVKGWAMDGLIEEEIAAKIGIYRSTLYRWKKAHPQIDEALRQGKEVIDRKVENSLLRRALGYTYDEITREKMDDGKLHIIKIVTKEQAPDTTAAIFWLKNRKSVEWRDARLHELEAKKLKADAEISEAKAKALRGDGSDTSLLESLINVIENHSSSNDNKTDTDEK